MRSLDAQVRQPIFKCLKPEPSICCSKKVELPESEPSIRRDGWGSEIGIHNWIIQNPGIWLFFERKRSTLCPLFRSSLGTDSLMFCVSSPELVPTFVFTLSPSPRFNPWLSLFHSYICLLLTVLLGRIYHHLLTYLSQNLSFDQLVFYNLHLFYI